LDKAFEVNRRTGSRAYALVGALFCLSSAAWAQIGLVHVTSCPAAAYPGTTCTFPASGTGNLLVVGWQIGGAANTATTISSMTDNVGNSYVEAGAAKSIDSSGGSVSDLWYAKNTVAGATTITLTPSASVTNAGVVVWEFSGVNQSAPLDGAAVLNSQAANATPTGATVTTTASADVVISLITVANNVTGIASGNAFTNDSLLKGNGWAHLISSSAGPYAAQWNQSPSGTFASSTVSFKAAAGVGTPLNACDLAPTFGTIDSSDVTAAVNMALGAQPCTANVEGAAKCTVVTVQRVIDASLGQVCVTYNGHGVTLNWVASTSQNIAGYNIYRGTVSGGPYTKVNPSLISGTSFSDSSVAAGLTYYYVATAVDISGNESGYSNQTVATIPTP